MSWALNANAVLAIISVMAAALYGVRLRNVDPSTLKVGVKTVPVAALAAMAVLAGTPVALIVGLALCALGDAFLAMRPERWFLPGLAAFLTGHVAYIVLFWQAGGGPAALIADPLPIAGAATLALFAAALLVWLRPGLGPMRGPVGAYIVAIVVMGALAMTLEDGQRLAAAGALMFIASDAVLAIELFRLPKNSPLQPWTSGFVWAAYYLGQVLILAAFMG